MNPMSPADRCRVFLKFVLAAFILVSFPTGFPATNDASGGVRIVKLYGTVEIIRAGATVGVFTQNTNQPPLRIGDRVRTGPDSGVSLLFSDNSVLTIGARGEIEIRTPETPKSGLTVHLWKGVLYFFHRGEAGRARIVTSGAPAGIEGTEIVMEVVTVGNSEQTTISVIDGKVRFGDGPDSLLLTNGESATARPGEAPRRAPGFIANNILQWAFYYPGIVDLRDLGLTEEEQRTLGDSLSAYRAGDLLAALAKYPRSRQGTSEAERVYHAALLLAVGEVQQTLVALDGLPASASNSNVPRIADALRQLIAAVKREERRAAFEPQLATELLAASYYEQSRALRGDSLATALKLARQAATDSPEFGFAWERVAELEFSFGHTERAVEALEKSIALSPRNAESLALRGFLLAAQNKTREALAQFDDSIAVDSGLGNAWLGRGLTRIRKGDTEGGREDLLVAAALEPQRAILRSYLAKAYATTGDRARARHELDLAKGIDPSDPTAWLYSALLDEQENRINEGVRDLEKSQDLNENRRVYRSNLLLDQDRAIRQANLARLYREAGLSDLAIPEAGQAVANNYGDFSAHLFLANAYEEQRSATGFSQRYETPQRSEQLLAALLGPADGRLLAQPVSQQEYTRLFEKDYFGVSSETAYLSRGAWSEYGAQYGSFGNMSYALEAYYQSDRGQTANSAFESRTLSVKAKQMLTPKDGVFVQVFDATVNGGDLAQRYDPRFNSGLTFDDRQRPGISLGYHREWSPESHTLVLGNHIEDRYRFQAPGGAATLLATDFGTPSFTVPTDITRDYTREFSVDSIEIQHILSYSIDTLIVGARFQSTRQTIDNSDVAYPGNLTRGDFAILFPFTPFAFPQEHVFVEGSRASIYLYDYLSLGDQLRLYGGVTADYLSIPRNDIAPPLSSERDHTSRALPAAGILWQPSGRATLRGAWSRAQTGLSFDQSVRLEPSQFAGQPLTFRGVMPDSLIGSVAGEQIEVWQAEARFEFLKNTYLVLAARQIESKAHHEIGAYVVDFFNDPALGLAGEGSSFRERSVSAALERLLGDNFGAAVRYEVAKDTLSQSLDGIDPLFFSNPGSRFSSQAVGTLQTVTLQGVAHVQAGYFAEVDASWRMQNGLLDTNLGGSLPDDAFWQVDVFAGYRSPHRRFEGEIGLLNVAGQDYRLHPINVWLDLPRQRTLSVRARFTF